MWCSFGCSWPQRRAVTDRPAQSRGPRHCTVLGSFRGQEITCPHVIAGTSPGGLESHGYSSLPHRVPPRSRGWLPRRDRPVVGASGAAAGRAGSSAPRDRRGRLGLAHAATPEDRDGAGARPFGGERVSERDSGAGDSRTAEASPLSSTPAAARPSAEMPPRGGSRSNTRLRTRDRAPCRHKGGRRSQSCCVGPSVRRTRRAVRFLTRWMGSEHDVEFLDRGENSHLR